MMIETCVKKSIGRNSETGLVNYADLKNIGPFHGFSVKKVSVGSSGIPSGRPPIDKGYLLMVSEGHHCVRYIGNSVDDQNQLIVMNPQWIKEDKYSQGWTTRWWIAAMDRFPRNRNDIVCVVEIKLMPLSGCST
jgi:hypothetical protein